MASFGNPVSCQKSFKILHFIEESLWFLESSQAERSSFPKETEKQRLARDFELRGHLRRGHERQHSTALVPPSLPEPAEAASDHCDVRGLAHSYDLAKSPQPSCSGPTASTWSPVWGPAHSQWDIPMPGPCQSRQKMIQWGTVRPVASRMRRWAPRTQPG